MLAKSVASRQWTSNLPFLSQRIQQTCGMATRNAKENGGGTEIRVVLRSFEEPLGLPPYTRKIALPESRVLYTVLRSPHVDKKSREQFQMKVKKQMLIIKAERHELSKKYFWLKRQRILGAQYEIIFSCKTRLDQGKVQKLLSAFLGEKFIWLMLVSALLCMVGIIIVSLDDTKTTTSLSAIASNPILGDVLALVSAALYAIYITLIRLKLPDNDDRKNGCIGMAQFVGFLVLLNLIIFLPVALVLLESEARKGKGPAETSRSGAA